MKMLSIQDCLDIRKNNFTLMRFLAAFAVLYGHSYPLSLGLKGGEDPISVLLIDLWGRSLASTAVDVFFVVSGFLICASFIQRKSLWIFAEARILRILPGLVVAVIFSILIGALVTTEPLVNYFTSPSTTSFFVHNATLLSGIQFDLPGVFLNNPYPGSVNGSLWTLPIEVRMYFWLAVLGSLTLLQSEKVFNLFFLLICLMYVQAPVGTFMLARDAEELRLGMLFLMGSFLYVNKHRISLGFGGMLMLVVLTYFTRQSGFAPYIKSIMLTYFVLLVALHPKLNLPSIDRWGDVSFGLYIYAFPVQQTVAYFLPGVRPLQMFAIASFITLILAISSWHFIEKPALSLKGKILRFKKEAKIEPA